MPVRQVNNLDKGSKGFISLSTLLYTPTLDPQLQSIGSFVASGPNGSLTSPLVLAAELWNASTSALQLISDAPPALRAEVRDVVSWARLGRYFSLKLQATIKIADYRHTVSSIEVPPPAAALAELVAAEQEWTQLIMSTSHLKQSIALLGPGLGLDALHQLLLCGLLATCSA